MESPVTGEFLAQRPVTRCFDVFFDLRLNKGLSKQSRSLWRHCNAYCWYPVVEGLISPTCVWHSPSAPCCRENISSGKDTCQHFEISHVIFWNRVVHFHEYFSYFNEYILHILTSNHQEFKFIFDFRWERSATGRCCRPYVWLKKQLMQRILLQRFNEMVWIFKMSLTSYNSFYNKYESKGYFATLLLEDDSLLS